LPAFSPHSYTNGSDEDWENSPLGDTDEFDGPDPSYGDLLATLPGWTGLAMVVIMIIAYPPVFFRRKAFNYFWFSHHLFIIVWTALFCVHGQANILERSTAVYWVAVPFTIYFVERVSRFASPTTNKTKILDACVSSKSVVLILEKPKSWSSKAHRAGTYAFLNIPHIAKYEWHPFTISSAPDDDYLRFHIRKAGDWTGKLYNMVEQIDLRSPDAHNASRRLQKWESFRLEDLDATRMLSDDEGREEKGADDDAIQVRKSKSANQVMSDEVLAKLHNFGEAPRERHIATARNYPNVSIEGPIGAPSDLYFTFTTSVLIAAGIGVTPMASVLREVIYTWYGRFIRTGKNFVGSPQDARVQRIYFYWITRDQQALRWFSDELTIISNMDPDNHMQISIYLSSVKPKDSNMIRGVVDKVHKKTGWDPISGVNSKFRTQFGRPNWDKVFSEIALQQEGQKIGVFFCGPQGLDRMLERCCRKHSIRHSNGIETKFKYHSENF